MKFNVQVLATVAVMTASLMAQESALSNADGNGDGDVTIKEFSDYASSKLPSFGQLEAFVKNVDVDGDGKISQSEFDRRGEVLRKLNSEPNRAQQGSASKMKSDGPHKVGDKASDFELQGIGKKIKLSERFGKNGRPVVVVFSRAHW